MITSLLYLIKILWGPKFIAFISHKVDQFEIDHTQPPQNKPVFSLTYKKSDVKKNKYPKNSQNDHFKQVILHMSK